MRSGTKVVCVDDTIRDDKMWDAINLFQEWVTKGNHYTIRDFYDNDGIVSGVTLEEIKNEPVYQKLLNRVQEPAFGVFRFRELLEEKVEEKIYEEIEI